MEKLLKQQAIVNFISQGVGGSANAPQSTLRFNALSGTMTVIDRRIAYNQACDLCVTSLDCIKRNR